MTYRVVQKEAGEGDSAPCLAPPGCRSLVATASWSGWPTLLIALLGVSLVCILLPAPLVAEDAFGAAFDEAWQGAIAQLPEAKRAWLEEPILDQSELLAFWRGHALRDTEGYFADLAKLKEEPAAAQQGLDQRQRQMEQDIKSAVHVALSQMLASEEMARKLGYTEWLSAPSPLLQEFPLPTAQLIALGFERSCATKLPAHSQRFNSAVGIRDFRTVDLHILPSRGATRLRLLHAPDFLPNPRDYHLCKKPHGEVCIERSTHYTDIRFARGNVIARVWGPEETVLAAASKIDEHIRKHLEASGVGGEQLDAPVFVPDPGGRGQVLPPEGP